MTRTAELGGSVLPDSVIMVAMGPRRWFVGAWLVLAACAPFEAAPSFRDASTEAAATDAAPSPLVADAASTDATTGDGAPSDAGSDCLTFSDDFASPPNGWQVLGDARLEGGEARLVPSEYSQHGALWRSMALSQRALHVVFRSRIEAADAGPADGLAFAWVDEDAGPPLGGPGNDLALCGVGPIDGYAVIVDSFYGTLHVRDLMDCSQLKSVTLPVTGEHTVDIVIKGNMLTATLDDVSLVVGLKRTTNVRWIGLTGSTGGYRAYHRVDDLALTACAL